MQQVVDVSEQRTRGRAELARQCQRRFLHRAPRLEVDLVVRQRLVTVLIAPQVAEIGKGGVARVVDVQLALGEEGKGRIRDHANDRRNRPDERVTIDGQLLVRLDEYQAGICSAQLGRERRHHACDHRVDEPDMFASECAQGLGQVRQHHTAEDLRRAVEILAQDQVEGLAVADLRTAGDAPRHHRRHLLQDACTHRRRADLGTGQHICHRVDLVAVQRGHRPDLHFFRALVRDQPDGVTPPRVKRVQQRPVHVGKGDRIARLAEELAHEPAADVARAEDDSLLHSYTCRA